MGNLISQADLFSEPPSLYIQGKIKHKTFTGGCLAIIAILILAYVFWISVYEIVSNTATPILGTELLNNLEDVSDREKIFQFE